MTNRPFTWIEVGRCSTCDVARQHQQPRSKSALSCCCSSNVKVLLQLMPVVQHVLGVMCAHIAVVCGSNCCSCVVMHVHCCSYISCQCCMFYVCTSSQLNVNCESSGQCSGAAAACISSCAHAATCSTQLLLVTECRQLSLY